MNELNTTNINFKDFDLQITLRETTEDTGLLFRYNTHITSKDIRMTYVKALWYYSISTIFKMNHEYQKFSWNVFLMMCAIMKTFGKLSENFRKNISRNFDFFFLIVVSLEVNHNKGIENGNWMIYLQSLVVFVYIAIYCTGNNDDNVLSPLNFSSKVINLHMSCLSW